MALFRPVTGAAAQVDWSCSRTPSLASLAHTRRRIAAAASSLKAPRRYTTPRWSNSARICRLSTPQTLHDGGPAATGQVCLGHPSPEPLKRLITSGHLLRILKTEAANGCYR